MTKNLSNPKLPAVMRMYIKHFPDLHFKAVTIDGRKFVYCPVGKICSWSIGDYDHSWCHWCKKFFEEIENGKA